MNLRVAEEIISEVTALPQGKARYNSFVGFLSSERSPEAVDNDMLEYLGEVSNDKGLVMEVAKYLEDINYSRQGYVVQPIVEQLERFCMDDHPDGRWRKGHKQAKEDMENEFQHFNLKSLVYGGNANIRDFVPRKDAHAGSIYLETGKREKGQYLDELPELYAQAEGKAREKGSFNRLILTMVRTGATHPYDDEGKPTGEFDLKPRVVSPISLDVVMAETRFANPLQRKFATLRWYAGGKDNHGIWINILAMQAKFRNGSWISLDYSKFDQSISSWLIYDAFDIMRKAFPEDSHFDDEIYRIIREDFIHKVFVGPEGKLYESHRGVPSGSMFTQIVDSIVNRLMIKALFNSFGWQEGKDYEMIIMGDDNLIYLKMPDPEPILDDISRMLMKCYGITCNTKKVRRGHCSVQPHFLSRDWNHLGIERDKREIITRLLYPESRRDYQGKEYTPGQIVQSYFYEYSLTMDQLINKPAHKDACARESRKVGADAWMTGLEKYRASLAKENRDVANTYYW